MGWGWALIRGWAPFNFSAFRMGAYSRWVLVRSWALIRINAVFLEQQHGDTASKDRFENERYISNDCALAIPSMDFGLPNILYVPLLGLKHIKLIQIDLA